MLCRIRYVFGMYGGTRRSPVLRSFLGCPEKENVAVQGLQNQHFESSLIEVGTPQSPKR